MNIEMSLQLLHRGWLGMGLHLNDEAPIICCPEALIIGLATVGRHDQRLFDEGLSFASQHSRIFRANYFKTWSKLLDDDDKSALRLILDMCGIKSKDSKNDQSIAPKLFFIKPSQSSYIGRSKDSFFESRGFLRNPFAPSNMVPDLNRSAQFNPWIRLRLSIGILAQSDVMMLALNATQITVPFASDILGVTPKSAWRILQDLVLANWLTKKTIGRKDYYRPTLAFQKNFDFLTVTEMIRTPLSWIEAATRAKWEQPEGASPEFMKMWTQQKEASLQPLFRIQDRLDELQKT